jgi:N-acetylmuramoyl-L-alanine amidase
MLFYKRLNKTAYFFILLCCCFTFFSASYGTVKPPYRIKTVVIDAGHGGHDSGCLGSSAKEKIIALDVALKLGALIEEKFPDVNVVYTRKTDEFVELHERAAIANRNHADLFICIHCNSGGPSAFGVETYVMGLHKTDDNLNVAKRENSSILLEKDFKQKYDGFDPNSPEANIVFSLYQNAYLTQSLKFASAVQGQVEEYAGRFNRGVKQAGFLVLYRTAMPSVLIETGFLTNNSEEKYLLSEKGQNNIASSVFKAFEEYKLDMETGSADAKTNQPTANGDVKKNLPDIKQDTSRKNTTQPDIKPVVSKSQPEIKHSTPPATTKDTVVQTQQQKPIASKDTTKNQPLSTKEPAKKDSLKNPVIVKEPSKKDSVKTVAAIKEPEKKEPAKNTIAKPTSPLKEELIIEKKESLPVLFYTVQLAALPDTSSAEMNRFQSLSDIKKFVADNGYIRICQGIFSTHVQALDNQNKLRAKGFADAFVTPYYKGKRISAQEAAAIKK